LFQSVVVGAEPIVEIPLHARVFNGMIIEMIAIRVTGGNKRQQSVAADLVED